MRFWSIEIQNVVSKLTNTCHFQHIDGVDYRKNIFIFTSNVGGREISQLALEFYLSNRRREDIKYEDLEKSVLVDYIQKYYIESG